MPAKDLLAQLPKKAGYALLQWVDEMPKTFIFEALPVKTKAQVLEENYPQMLQLLTPIEWKLFTCLHERGKVRYSTLMFDLNLEDEEGFMRTSNVLHVHVKNLRAKIRYNMLPFKIITIESNSYMEGGYQLEKTES